MYALSGRSSVCVYGSVLEFLCTCYQSPPEYCSKSKYTSTVKDAPMCTNVYWLYITPSLTRSDFCGLGTSGYPTMHFKFTQVCTAEVHSILQKAICVPSACQRINIFAAPLVQTHPRVCCRQSLFLLLHCAKIIKMGARK